MSRILEPGKDKQVMTWKLLLMALVIAFFAGVAFMAVTYALFKMF